MNSDHRNRPGRTSASGGRHAATWRCVPGLFLFLLLLPTFSPALMVSGGGFPEYQVKAEMLFRIAEFVDWPAGTFPRQDKPFVIGIAGKDPFGPYLTGKAKTQKIHGAFVEIRAFDPEAASDSFHLVFISEQERDKVSSLLKKIAGRPILSVSDGEGFSRDGVHVGFLTVDERIRFNINLGSAKQSGFVFPANLLRLAARVYREGGR